VCPLLSLLRTPFILVSSLWHRAHTETLDSREAFDEKEGNIDLKDWLSLIDGSGVAGETLDELRDRLEALRDEQETLFSDFMLANEGEEKEAIKTKLMALKKEGQAIKSTIADKEEIARKRVAQRKANEAAKAATPVAA